MFLILSCRWCVANEKKVSCSVTGRWLYIPPSFTVTSWPFVRTVRWKGFHSSTAAHRNTTLFSLRPICVTSYVTEPFANGKSWPSWCMPVCVWLWKRKTNRKLILMVLRFSFRKIAPLLLAYFYSLACECGSHRPMASECVKVFTFEMG